MNQKSFSSWNMSLYSMNSLPSKVKVFGPAPYAISLYKYLISFLTISYFYKCIPIWEYT